MQKAHQAYIQKAHIQKAHIMEVSDFVAKYASALLSNGAYTSRVARCTERIAESFGYDVHLNIFLKYIILNVIDKQNYDNRYTQVINNTQPNVNLALITHLSALSWQIYDEHLSLKEAKIGFEDMMHKARLAPIPTAFFVSFANATFCKLFGGDFGALVCIFMGTFVGFWLRFFCQKIKLDMRAQFLFTSFLSSFVAYIGVWLGLTHTPEIAIGGSILYLIPGVLIINALVDIIQENTLMGVSRTINMIVVMLCLAGGVYMTLEITKVSILNV